MNAPAVAFALQTAEDELQQLRGRMAIVAQFIHDPAHDADARRALAQRLGLPEPAASKGASNGH